MEDIPLTRPTGFELLTRSTKFLEKNEKEHELEVNPDSEPSSSDSLETYSLDSRAKKKKIKKKKKCRKHQKYDSSYPSLSDDSDSLMTFIIDTSNKKIGNIVKSTQSNYAQL